MPGQELYTQASFCSRLLLRSTTSQKTRGQVTFRDQPKTHNPHTREAPWKTIKVNVPGSSGRQCHLGVTGKLSPKQDLYTDNTG